jgi:hypothetical protein
MKNIFPDFSLFFDEKPAKEKSGIMFLELSFLSLGLSGRRPKVSEKGISSHDRVVDREGNKKC